MQKVCIFCPCAFFCSWLGGKQTRKVDDVAPPSTVSDDPSPAVLRQQSLYDSIQRREKISLKELIAQHPTVSKRTLQDDLVFLKSRQLIDCRGRGRVAFWFVRPKLPNSQAHSNSTGNGTAMVRVKSESLFRKTNL